MPTFRDDSEDLLDAAADNPTRAHRAVRQSIAAKTAALAALRVDHNGHPLPDGVEPERWDITGAVVNPEAYAGPAPDPSQGYSGGGLPRAVTNRERDAAVAHMRRTGSSYADAVQNVQAAAITNPPPTAA